MKKVVALFMLAIYISGCAGIGTAISAKDMRTDSEITHPIMLEPMSANGHRYVYVDVHTPQKYAAYDISGMVKRNLASRGFSLTHEPEKATYTLQARLTKMYEPTHEEYAATDYKGFGETIIVGALGATFGQAAGGSNGALIGASLGMALGALGSTIVNNAIKERLYVAVTDVQIGQITAGKVVGRTMINNAQGMGGNTHQDVVTIGNRTYHRTRMINRAYQANLKPDEAAMVLANDLAETLAGLL